jgi:hypothetical protein
MQVNWHSHGAAFASAAAALNPTLNARYAAALLGDYRRQTGSRADAVGLYHSHTPALAEAYCCRVARALRPAQRLGTVRRSGGRISPFQMRTASCPVWRAKYSWRRGSAGQCPCCRAAWSDEERPRGGEEVAGSSPAAATIGETHRFAILAGFGCGQSRAAGNWPSRGIRQPSHSDNRIRGRCGCARTQDRQCGTSCGCA